MADIDGLNNSLSGENGTGSFVASSDPVMSGDCDLSGASSLIMPNSGTPSLNVTGEMVIDNAVSGYPGIVKYYSGTEEMSMIPMSSADITALTDGQGLGYVSANSKIEGKTLVGGVSTGKVIQVQQFTSTTLDVTTSLSAVDTSLSGSITPTVGTNEIEITFSGLYIVESTGTSLFDRWGTFLMNRTAPSATTISEAEVGFSLRNSLATPHPILSPVYMKNIELASSTAVHTYIMRFFVPLSGLQISLDGTAYTATLTLIEREP